MDRLVAPAAPGKKLAKSVMAAVVPKTLETSEQSASENASPMPVIIELSVLKCKIMTRLFVGFFFCAGHEFLPCYRVPVLLEFVPGVDDFLKDAVGEETEVILVDEERCDADDEGDESGDTSHRVQEPHAFLVHATLPHVSVNSKF